MTGTISDSLTFLLAVGPGLCTFFLVIYLGSVALRYQREEVSEKIRSARIKIRRFRFLIDAHGDEAKLVSRTILDYERKLTGYRQAVNSCLDLLRTRCNELSEVLEVDESTSVTVAAARAIQTHQRLFMAWQELTLLETKHQAVLRQGRDQVKASFRRRCVENPKPIPPQACSARDVVHLAS